MIQLVLAPASTAIAEMVDKEEQILPPMSLEPSATPRHPCPAKPGVWLLPTIRRKRGAPRASPRSRLPEEQRVSLPTGSLTPAELHAIFSTIPFDLTFVDR